MPLLQTQLDNEWRVLKNFERKANNERFNHWMRAKPFPHELKQKFEFIEKHKFTLFLKYSDAQPRHPAGTREGGRFSRGGAASALGGLILWNEANKEKEEAKNPPQKTPEEIEKDKETQEKLDGVLDGKTVKDGTTKGNTEIEHVPGGTAEEAKEDFDKINPEDVVIYNTPLGELRTGVLPNGNKIIVRSSQEGRPTLEIQNPRKGRTIRKIRYGD
jgi:hypothetical protein